MKNQDNILMFTGELIRKIPDDAVTLWDLSDEQADKEIAGYIYPDEYYKEQELEQEKEYLQQLNNSIIRFIMETYSDAGFDVHDQYFIYDISVICSMLSSVIYEHVGLEHPMYHVFDNMKTTSGFTLEAYLETSEQQEDEDEIDPDEE